MLERKRRARINKCLDELKDLMVATLESEGEHVTRLEKADILELTVSHLYKLKQKRLLTTNSCSMTQAEGFRSGYIHAVNEVSRSLSELPGINVNLGTKLMSHLGQRLNQLQPSVKPAVPVTVPLSIHTGASHHSDQLSTTNSSTSGYISSPDSHHSYKQSNTNLLTTCSNLHLKQNFSHCQRANEEDETVWRPW